MTTAVGDNQNIGPKAGTRSWNRGGAVSGAICFLTHSRGPYELLAKPRRVRLPDMALLAQAQRPGLRRRTRRREMTGNLTLDAFKDLTASGEIDTVIACIVDMQGRLQGKRFVAQHFVDTAWEETHCCNYLLATDLEMWTVEGYESTSWRAGYGDYMMKPDLSTLRGRGLAAAHRDGALRRARPPRPRPDRPFAARDAADPGRPAGGDGARGDHRHRARVLHLQEELRGAASEGYRDLAPLTDYNADYSLHLGTKDEPVMHPLRQGLYAVRRAGRGHEGRGRGRAGGAQHPLRHRPRPAPSTIRSPSTPPRRWASSPATR